MYNVACVYVMGRKPLSGLSDCISGVHPSVSIRMRLKLIEFCIIEKFFNQFFIFTAYNCAYACSFNQKIPFELAEPLHESSSNLLKITEYSARLCIPKWINSSRH